MFKKVCYNCGAKVDSVHDGLCLKCFKKEEPPIKEIKPINLKYCNMCMKIHLNNSLYTFEQLGEVLPTVMKKRVVLNEGYKLNSLQIKDLQRQGNKILFDIVVDCDII